MSFKIKTPNQFLLITVKDINNILFTSDLLLAIGKLLDIDNIISYSLTFEIDSLTTNKNARTSFSKKELEQILKDNITLQLIFPTILNKPRIEIIILMYEYIFNLTVPYEELDENIIIKTNEIEKVLCNLYLFSFCYGIRFVPDYTSHLKFPKLSLTDPPEIRIEHSCFSFFPNKSVNKPDVRYNHLCGCCLDDLKNPLNKIVKISDDYVEVLSEQMSCSYGSSHSSAFMLRKINCNT